MSSIYRLDGYKVQSVCIFPWTVFTIYVYKVNISNHDDKIDILTHPDEVIILHRFPLRATVCDLVTVGYPDHGQPPCHRTQRLRARIIETPTNKYFDTPPHRSNTLFNQSI